MSKAAVHAAPRGRAWGVHRTGAGRAIRAGLSEAEAWRLACELARNDGAIAYRHGADGRIVEQRRPGI